MFNTDQGIDSSERASRPSFRQIRNQGCPNGIIREMSVKERRREEISGVDPTKLQANMFA